MVLGKVLNKCLVFIGEENTHIYIYIYISKNYEKVLGIPVGEPVSQKCDMVS